MGRKSAIVSFVEGSATTVQYISENDCEYMSQGWVGVAVKTRQLLEVKHVSMTSPQ